MLRDCINTVAAKIEEMKLFSKVYHLADRVTDGVRIWPAIYDGDGQLVPIQYDSEAAMCYIRKNGKFQISEVTDERYKTTSCPDTIYRMVFPLKLVAFIPKTKADCNDSYADDFFAEHLISSLTIKAFELEINRAKFTATAIETDNIKVLQEEYSNWKEIVDLNYSWAYLSVDWNLEVIIDNNCLKKKCDQHLS